MFELVRKTGRVLLRRESKLLFFFFTQLISCLLLLLFYLTFDRSKRVFSFVDLIFGSI